MKTPLLFLGFTLAAASLPAAAPHPSVLTVRYKDQMLPVVRVDGSDPYVLVDGRETIVRSEPIYFIQDADRFSDNFAEAPRGALGGKMHMEVIGDYGYNPDSLHSGQIDIAFPVKAQKAIKGGFAAVVMYSSVEHPEVIVHQLPDLPAGQQVKVTISVHALPQTTEPRYFVQIFDETGREVPTNGMEQAWRYYEQRDRVRVAAAIKSYVEKYKGADHPAVPVQMPHPIFDPRAVLPQGEVVVTLSVSSEGLVTDVDAGMIGDDRARNNVIQALGGWLFLPKLKAGEPVYTQIKVPLQF